ncbi:MAG: nucleoside hydrolase [Bacteroidales bacterium]|nr:nucleoside hydrolase [Bacteroidales bacterium]
MASCIEQRPVNLIFDTDLGPDYDDVGALALLHALADSGQVNILATVSSNRDERVVPCIEAINTWYGRPDIPVAAPKSSGGASLTTWHKIKWTEVLPQKYPHKTKRTSDAPDAVKIYRQILSSQPDNSVVICSVGFFTNLKDLLHSAADQYSPLSGRELVARKVKRLISMAGSFPEGKEFNVYMDAPAAIATVDEWPTEIILSGFEIGVVILTGKKLVKMPDTGNPVKEVYELCFAEGDPNGRSSWDITAALIAVKGYERYFDSERGTMYVNDDGYNTWTPAADGHFVRLIAKYPPEYIADILETYMMKHPEN